MSTRPKSTFVISLTAFDHAGELDEAALRAHYTRLREAGIGVYVAGSGSGEAYSLTDDERQRVLEIAAEELKGNVPVRAMGKEPRTSGEMIAFGKAVQRAELDAMQVYSLDLGHGVVPSPAEIERYLDDVLSEVGVPAVISTHFLSGYTIPIDVLARVVDRYDVVGINCTVPDLPGMSYLVKLIEAFGDAVEIHVGGPMQALTAMALGATGYLSSEGNLVPRLCTSVTDHYNRRDFDASQDAYHTLMRLFAANQYSGIKGLKAALEILGLPGGPPRAPRLPVTDEERADIERALEELKIEELL